MYAPQFPGTLLQRRALGASLDAPVFPHHADGIPPGVVDAGSYEARFAWTRSDLHAVQKLRYSVFQLELGEGPAHAVLAGLDEDARDPWFHHLMICHRPTGEVVGTYRLQTAVMAATRHGFSSASLFELGAIPARILDDSVEIGRACVAPAHRSGRVLRLLWKGLARYLQWNGKRFLFGCCSLPGTEGVVAQELWRVLHRRQLLHASVHVRPRAEARALPDDGRARPTSRPGEDAFQLPALLDGYLSLGARVCGPPAVDREFGTTDVLVMLDVQSLDTRMYQSYLG